MSTLPLPDSIWTGAFWKATAERVITTAAETAAGVLAVSVAIDDFPDQAWWSVAVAAGVTLLKAVATNAVTKDGPGIGGQEVVTATTPLPPLPG